MSNKHYKINILLYTHNSNHSEKVINFMLCINQIYKQNLL